MSDSDDPWPGACCGRSGFVSHSYYEYRYTMSESFCTFFNINIRARYTTYQLEGYIIDYIHTHNGYTNQTVNYDKDLWTLFGLSPHDPFKPRSIPNYIVIFQRGERPCPICKQQRPFDPRIPNGLCDSCCHSPDLLSNGQPTVITKPKWVPLSAGFFTRTEEPIEMNYTLHNVPCRRTDSDDVLLEAVVSCPICMVEVKEERRLGAFCDRCARSESLTDGNGNRVRFKPPNYDEVGFRVVSYENGEIIERLHVGEFTCFFQGVPCVAEDTGTKARVIVRFLHSTSRSWPTMPPPMKGSFYMVGSTEIKEEEWIVASSSDWLDPGYPRWAMYK